MQLSFPNFLPAFFRMLLLYMIVLGLLLICSGCDRQNPKKQSPPLITIHLAQELHLSSSLMRVALDQGYFKKNGLHVIAEDYPSGKRCLLEALFPGKADIAIASEFPATLAGIDSQDFRILATIFRTDDVNSIVARRDRGINQPSDLKGKRLATQQFSAVHYFLHLFLLDHNLSEEDVDIFFYKAEQLPEKLISGTIDAFSMRTPYIEQAMTQLGEKGLCFRAPGLYEQHGLLLARNAFLQHNPDAAKRLLKALLEAEEYSAAHPGKVQDLLAGQLLVNSNELKSIWTGISLEVILDQSLIVRMEDEARWLLQRKGMTSTSVPNYLELIETTPLLQLKPMQMTIH